MRPLTNVGERTLLTSIGFLSLGLVLGCASGPGDADGTTGAAGTTAGTSAGTTAGTSAGTTTGTSAGTTTGDEENPGEELYPCVPGIPVTTQVGRLLNREYDNAVYDLLGVTGLTSENNQPPSALLPADSEGAMDPYRWTAYQLVAEAISTQVINGPNKAKFMSCDPATVATCYADTITSFGRKAFRRPVTDTERQLFLALTTIEPAGTPDQIAQTLLYAFLVSPSFIAATEIGTEPATENPGAIQLTDHEVALRLSRMLWGGLPDEILAKAADDGLLSTPEQVAEQAARMMAVREKAAAQVATAHRAYLDIDDEASHWWKSAHDPALFPTYNGDAKASLADEYDAFFEDVVFNNGTFRDLFLSNKGFVNAATAPFYGLNPSEFGAELQPYEFEASQRPGMLTRAGFLDSFSNYDATSPIRRGAFLATKIIGVKVGAPDPEALKAQVPPGNYDTRRKQIDALTEDAQCKTCHQEAVNPPGYILENFDAMGVWQVTDRLGGDIVVEADVGFGDNDLRTISSVVQLMEEIAANPVSQKIYAQKMVSVGMGRLPNSQDACIRDEIVANLAGDGYPILNVFTDMTRADSFRLRTRGE